MLNRNRPHAPGIAFVCPPWLSAIESIWVQRGHFHGFYIASHQEKRGHSVAIDCFYLHKKNMSKIQK